ncbi:hypothetical protein [Streptomyces sp. HF10]|uniref:hypothetical protein n=1 Tax=Streptomyces sp. HF10 TaxID=2692233 RepID=UPI0019160732|nr:hypothetical protein [Streptomyces sp. HF10]
MCWCTSSDSLRQQLREHNCVLRETERSANTTADLAVDSGQCLLGLGRTTEARARIAEGIALLPRARDKTRGIFLTYQARGCLEAGDIEQALAVTGESLDLATRIGAPRCVTLVRELAPAFEPYRRVDGVPEFLERLRAS